MSLKLMYITNNPDVAKIAEEAGVDRIFVDMEFIGKASRQGGMDTVQCHHTVADVRKLRPCCPQGPADGAGEPHPQRNQGLLLL